MGVAGYYTIGTSTHDMTNIFTQNSSQDPNNTTNNQNPQCSTNNNNRKGKVCGACEGKGWLTCEDCGGDGIVECPNCHSTGKTGFINPKTGKRVEFNCEACNGAGKWKCPNCNNGKKTCYICGGDGWITPEEQKKLDEIYG